MVSPRWPAQPRQRGPVNDPRAYFRTFQTGQAFRCVLLAQSETTSPVDVIGNHLSPRDLLDLVMLYGEGPISLAIYDWSLPRIEQEAWTVLQNIGRLHQVVRRNNRSAAINQRMLNEYPASVHARQFRRPAPWQITGQWPRSDP